MAERMVKCIKLGRELPGLIGKIIDIAPDKFLSVMPKGAEDASPAMTPAVQAPRFRKRKR